MSNRPPVRRPSSASAPDDDAFVAGALEFSAWARRNRTLLVAGVVALVSVVVITLYVRSIRADARARAAGELEAIAQLVEFGDRDTALESLNRFLERYGDTRFGLEGRLLLGQLHLQSGDPEAAVAVLQPAARSLREPLGIQAALLLAAAYEDLERWADAERLYLDVSRSNALAFQIRDALADAARVRLEQGNREGAIQLYRQLLDRVEADDPARGIFELRLGELTAGG